MLRLLLHICCGPCATTVIERLKDDYEVTGYFYNPCVYPDSEYRNRLEAAREVANRLSITLIEGRYEPQSFFDAVRGLEAEPENGTRCQVCYHQRLAATASYAVEVSYDIVASTLTVGPMKNAAIINPIGIEEAESAGVTFHAVDWKKKDGFKHSCELSREFGIYRQQYCGCLFSVRK